MKRASLFVVTLLALGIVSCSPPALAHTIEEQEAWYQSWEERVFEEGGLTEDLVTEYQDFAKRHEQLIAPVVSRVVSSPSHDPSPPPTVTVNLGVEQWRGLVSLYFPAENVDRALRVMWCESKGNPYAKNPRSSASGLFQFLQGWWSGAWGYPGGAFDPFDPEENVKAAAWLSKGGTDWSHWVCKG